MYNKSLINVNKVKQEICFEFSEGEKKKIKEIKKYDEEGKLNGYFSEENENKLEFYDISSFDKDGYQIMEIFYDCENFEHGYPQKYSTKEINIMRLDETYYESKKYDNKGKCIDKSIEINETWSIGKDMECKYVYNNKGKIIRKYLSRFENNRKLVFCLNFDKIMYCIEKSVYTYNNNNNIVKEESWSNYVKGYLEPLVYEHEHRIFEFDDRNNRTEERYIRPDGTEMWKDSLSFKHDENGRLVKLIQYDDSGEKYIIDTFYYDAKGNDINEISEKANGEKISEIKREYYDNGLMKSYLFKNMESKIFQGTLYEYEYFE